MILIFQVSVSNDLKYDAERDLRDIGAHGMDVHFLSKMKYGKINSSINGYVKKGVMYATYSAVSLVFHKPYCHISSKMNSIPDSLKNVAWHESNHLYFIKPKKIMIYQEGSMV